jgi:3-(3-hydroxy-phenyl)propionate hydroxylase
VLRMTALAWAVGLAVQTRHPVAASARDAVVRVLLRSPGMGAWVQRGGWKPSPAYRRGLVARTHGARAGELLPQPTVTTPAATRMPLDQALGPGFALVGVGLNPAERLDSASQRLLERLAARAVEVGDAGLRDEEGALAAWFGRAGDVALVRPDRFVFGASRAEEASQLLGELAEALGTPNEPEARLVGEP